MKSFTLEELSAADREIRDEVDADILQMDQEDMVDEIMTLRAALKEAVKLKSEWYDTAAKVLLTGFKRAAVIDDKTCLTCRVRSGSWILDAGELTKDCTAEGGCRCAAVPV